MTEEPQRIAIAKFLGWSGIRKVGPDGEVGWPYPGKIIGWTPDDQYQEEIPPLTLDTMYSAEALLDDAGWCGFAIHLSNVVGLPLDWWMTIDSKKIIHATALQRSEALLRSTGNWIG